jgi:hypothetical protein
MSRITAVLFMLAAACKSEEHDPAQTQPPRIDRSPSYLRLRAAILESLSKFPTNPGSLPRCDPGLTGVSVLEFHCAGSALDLSGWSVGAGTSMCQGLGEVLEQVEKNRVTTGELSEPEHIAVFRQSAVTPAKLDNCQQLDRRRECDLRPGSYVGDLVVFDRHGKPQCGVHVEFAGPSFFSGLNDNIDDDMKRWLMELLTGGMFHDKGAAASLPAKWRVLEPHDQYAFTSACELALDGVVVLAPDPVTP